MEVPRDKTPATSLPRPSLKARSFLPGARVAFAFVLALAFAFVRGFAGVRLRLPVALARGFAVLVCFAFCAVAKVIPGYLHGAPNLTLNYIQLQKNINRNMDLNKCPEASCANDLLNCATNEQSRYPQPQENLHETPSQFICPWPRSHHAARC